MTLFLRNSRALASGGSSSKKLSSGFINMPALVSAMMTSIVVILLSQVAHFRRRLWPIVWRRESITSIIPLHTGHLWSRSATEAARHRVRPQGYQCDDEQAGRNGLQAAAVQSLVALLRKLGRTSAPAPENGSRRSAPSRGTQGRSTVGSQRFLKNPVRSV